MKYDFINLIITRKLPERRKEDRATREVWHHDAVSLLQSDCWSSTLENEIDCLKLCSELCSTKQQMYNLPVLRMFLPVRKTRSLKAGFGNQLRSAYQWQSSSDAYRSKLHQRPHMMWEQSAKLIGKEGRGLWAKLGPRIGSRNAKATHTTTESSLFPQAI